MIGDGAPVNDVAPWIVALELLRLVLHHSDALVQEAYDEPRLVVAVLLAASRRR